VQQTSNYLSWILVLGIAILFGLMFILFAAVMPKFKKLQTLIDKINLVAREILTGIPVIRAFATEKHEEERFDDANKRLKKTNLIVNRAMAILMPVMMLIMNGLAVLIVYTGSKGIDAGKLQVGDMMAFIQYAMQIIISFLMIAAVAIFLPRASVSAKRIQEILDTEPEVNDPENPVTPAEGVEGTMEFKNVSFAYPGAEEDTLHNISFKVEKGDTVAFIGSTGSGKSTLVNLIPRFFDVTSGEILIDGVNVKDMSLKDLRRRLGYVPQKSVLFSGSIDYNMRFGKEDATEAEIRKALEIAQAADFVDEKEGGVDSHIAQGGSNVSGGQKQRLAIARAIARKPEFYIFDDSFSALDFATDSRLRKALKKETGNVTTLIVAQRVSTIMHADKILVLEEGSVVGEGTHEELMETCDVYRQIAESQLSEREMAG
ncbi:MAG: ABC transporter ATP-binding protein, partial [Lachnospiraceae bacterium]|nr:ABC transporter ATP-binding protein [Lachnospiraceae bacterium]